jgi:hypothetical protein
MFVFVEKSPGAYKMRLVTNDEVLGQLRGQGALQSFLEDADRLYADFRSRFEDDAISKPPN